MRFWKITYADDSTFFVKAANYFDARSRGRMHSWRGIYSIVLVDA